MDSLLESAFDPLTDGGGGGKFDRVLAEGIGVTICWGLFAILIHRI